MTKLYLRSNPVANTVEITLFKLWVVSKHNVILIVLQGRKCHVKEEKGKKDVIDWTSLTLVDFDPKLILKLLISKLLISSLSFLLQLFYYSYINIWVNIVCQSRPWISLGNLEVEHYTHVWISWSRVWIYNLIYYGYLTHTLFWNQIYAHLRMDAKSNRNCPWSPTMWEWG